MFVCFLISSTEWLSSNGSKRQEINICFADYSMLKSHDNDAIDLSGSQGEDEIKKMCRRAKERKFQKDFCCQDKQKIFTPFQNINFWVLFQLVKLKHKVQFYNGTKFSLSLSPHFHMMHQIVMRIFNRLNESLGKCMCVL